jgi:hypothetical protein
MFMAAKPLRLKFAFMPIKCLLKAIYSDALLFITNTLMKKTLLFICFAVAPGPALAQKNATMSLRRLILSLETDTATAATDIMANQEIGFQPLKFKLTGMRAVGSAHKTTNIHKEEEMANTYHQLCQQTVFAVKYRGAVIKTEWQSQLLGVIGNLMNNCKIDHDVQYIFQDLT